MEWARVPLPALLAALFCPLRCPLRCPPAWRWRRSSCCRYTRVASRAPGLARPFTPRAANAPLEQLCDILAGGTWAGGAGGRGGGRGGALRAGRPTGRRRRGRGATTTKCRAASDGGARRRAAAHHAVGGGRPARAKVLLQVRQQTALARAVLPPVWRTHGADLRVRFGLSLCALLPCGLRPSYEPAWPTRHI